MNNFYHLPVIKWPYVSAAFAKNNLDEIKNALITALDFCNKNNLEFHELGTSRLLQRIFKKNFLKTEREKILLEKVSIIDLGKNYKLVTNQILLKKIFNPDDLMWLEYDKKNISIKFGTLDVFDDASFAILSNEQLVCTGVASVVSTFFIHERQKNPIKLKFFNSKFDALYIVKALCILQVIYNTPGLEISEYDSDSMALYKSLDQNTVKFFTEIFLTQEVNLSLSEELLFKEVRSSYKSHINWSKNNINFKRVFAADITSSFQEELFRKLNTFHRKKIDLYGNHTSLVNFNLTIEFCKKGRGHVFLAYNNINEIIGLVIFVDDGITSMYMEGGFIEKNGGKILSYGLIWHAIISLKKLGISRVILENFKRPPLSGISGARAEWKANLSFFKSGFSRSPRIDFIYSIVDWNPKVLENFFNI